MAEAAPSHGPAQGRAVISRRRSRRYRRDIAACASLRRRAKVAPRYKPAQGSTVIHDLGADTEVAAPDEALAHQVSATKLAVHRPPKQMAAAPAASRGRRGARPNPRCWRHSGRARRAAGRQGRPPRLAAGDHLPTRCTASKLVRRPIERGWRQRPLADALATSISAH